MQTKLKTDGPAREADVQTKPDESQAQPKGQPLVSIDSAIFDDVQVALRAKLGQTTLSIEELLALRAGSVVKLDLKVNDLIEMSLNGTLVARGEIVAVGEHFGVRLVEVGKVS